MSDEKATLRWRICNTTAHGKEGAKGQCHGRVNDLIRNVERAVSPKFANLKASIPAAKYEMLIALQEGL